MNQHGRRAASGGTRTRGGGCDEQAAVARGFLVDVALPHENRPAHTRNRECLLVAAERRGGDPTAWWHAGRSSDIGQMDRLCLEFLAQRCAFATTL